MKSFITILVVFAAVLATGFLISAYILFFSYSSGSSANERNENLLNTTSIISSSSAEFISKADSDRRVADTLTESNVKRFSKK
jgi:Na+-transporting NADH:ubiquinone oxidoreductase subunit NqrC